MDGIGWDGMESAWCCSFGIECDIDEGTINQTIKMTATYNIKTPHLHGGCGGLPSGDALLVIQ
jgi:hypothetical protein